MSNPILEAVPTYNRVDKLSGVFLEGYHNFPFPKLDTLIGLPLRSGSLSCFRFYPHCICSLFFGKLTNLFI